MVHVHGEQSLVAFLYMMMHVQYMSMQDLVATWTCTLCLQTAGLAQIWPLCYLVLMYFGVDQLCRIRHLLLLPPVHEVWLQW